MSDTIYKSAADLNRAVSSASEAGAAGYPLWAAPKIKRAKADLSIRDTYNDANYYNKRPGEMVPSDYRSILYDCNESYYDFGIVRNIVDLMSDFCVKGIDWVHTNRNVQAFYRAWFRNVGGYDVSERFCNYLIRLGNNCIYTNYANIPDKLAEQWRKTKGEEFADIKYKSMRIPSQYVFLNVLSLNEVYPELGTFSNNRIFDLTLGTGIASAYNSYRSIRGVNSVREIVSSIPEQLRNKITKNGGSIRLTSEDIQLFHYKKDDWDNWSYPLIYSILEPLKLLRKMHLADRSALDGAISNIRLWKLGYIDTNNALNSIIPTKTMLNKVREIVLNNISGGVLDIFWGPELDFKESSSQVYKFLTNEKYKHVMSMIYDGMGIPPALSGGSGGSGGDSGFTNNFISMKVLIEKLNYLREKLISFWMAEAKKVQKAMGFSSPAELVFDDAIISDEATYKKLLLDLNDRSIISDEAIREEFNYKNNIENSRILREGKRRKKGTSPPKAGPYHDPMWKTSLESDMIKNGLLDPSVYGLEVTTKDIEAKLTPQDGGRPLGSKDTKPRKKPVVGPRTSAQILETHVWAREAYDQISNEISSKYVNMLGKTYARDLTNEEIDNLESIKFGVLCKFAPFTKLDSGIIAQACEDIGDYSLAKAFREEICKGFVEKFKRKLSIEDKRIASCAAYSLLKIE